MNDKDLKPRGVVNPKGTTWLKEVRLDAARNTVEVLRRQQETKEFEQAKARGITTEDIISKGREDLDLPEPEFEGEGGFEADVQPKETKKKETK